MWTGRSPSPAGSTRGASRARRAAGSRIRSILLRPHAAALLAAALGCSGGPFDEVALQAVELRAAPKLEFLRARVGMKFLEVRFEFENLADEPLTLKALDFSLRDTEGRLHPYSAQVLDLGQPRGSAKAVLGPGERKRGSVVFQIPETAQPGALIYRQDLGGGLAVRLLSSD